jgi:predicted O-methyltransferase YrrM
MLKSKRLKELLRFRFYLNKNARNISDGRASLILHGLFDKGTVLPFNPFSLNPNTILHLVNEIIINERKNVLEFGCGISTLVLAKYIQLNELPVSIVSVDDNKDWIDLIREQLKKHNCESSVTLVHAPITGYSSAQHRGSWYDAVIVRKALTDKQVDLMIVDGPGANTCEMARFPAMEVAESFLTNNFLVVLDDIRRKDEKEILRRWKNHLNSTKSVKIDWNEADVYGTILCGNGFSSKPLSY